VSMTLNLFRNRWLDLDCGRDIFLFRACGLAKCDRSCTLGQRFLIFTLVIAIRGGNK